MNGLTEVLVFRVSPSLRRRAHRVLRVKSAGRSTRISLSDAGREWLLAGLQRDEKELGLDKGKAVAA